METLELVLDETLLHNEDACESRYCSDTLRKGAHRADYFMGMPCGNILTVCTDRILRLAVQPRVSCSHCGDIHSEDAISRTPIP